ncbi:hypothetical protein D3C73_1439730 [compost metagenome]
MDCSGFRPSTRSRIVFCLIMNMLSRFSLSRMFISLTIRSIGRYKEREVIQDKPTPPTRIRAAISRVAFRMLSVCLVIIS